MNSYNMSNFVGTPLYIDIFFPLNTNFEINIQLFAYQTFCKPSYAKNGHLGLFGIKFVCLEQLANER